MAELRKFQYRGFEFSKIKDMDVKEFSNIVTSRVRRSLKRGFTEQQKILLKKIKKQKAVLDSGKEPKTIKTHCRDMVVLPIMVGLKIAVHNGKEFVPVEITPERLGHILGEFTYNRKRVGHHSPGVGATRGSAFVPTK